MKTNTIAKWIMLTILIMSVILAGCNKEQKPLVEKEVAQKPSLANLTPEAPDKQIPLSNTETEQPAQITENQESVSGAKIIENKTVRANEQNNAEVSIQKSSGTSKEYPNMPTEYVIKDEPKDNSTAKDLELTGLIEAAIKKSVDYIFKYYDGNKSAEVVEWPAAALRSAGVDLKTGRWKNVIDAASIKREKEIREEIDFDARRNTDYQRIIISLLSTGRNPYSYSGKNWVDIVKRTQQMNGKFADSVDEGGENLVNAHVWGIISLYAAGEKPADPEKAYQWLVKHQNSDGGFGIDISSDSSDIDMTGMSLIALGILNKDNKDACVQKALKYLQNEQLDNGGFSIWGEENPETAASVLQGLIAVGEDPLSSKWRKGDGKDIIRFILSFQLSDGSFSHTRGSGGDMMATYKSLMALGDYYYNKPIFKRLLK